MKDGMIKYIHLITKLRSIRNDLTERLIVDEIQKLAQGSVCLSINCYVARNEEWWR